MVVFADHLSFSAKYEIMHSSMMSNETPVNETAVYEMVVSVAAREKC